MTDEFASLVVPIYEHVIDFQLRVERGEHPDRRAESDALKALIADAEQKSTRSSALAADFALSKFGLIYWIDEVLINSKWEHAAEWKEHILELDYFRTREAGDDFYIKARDAEARQGTDPLEVYFLCVALGFRGTLGFDRQELIKWAERVYARILQGSRQPEKFLPDEKADEDHEPLRELPGQRAFLTVCILVAVTWAVSVATYIGVVGLPF